MNLTFDEYEEKDYDDLREMMAALDAEDPTDDKFEEEKLKNTIRESKARPEKLRIVMIRADGVNIGYCLVVFFWVNEYNGNVIDIDELYIKKGYRNKKVATRFIENQMTAYENTAALKIEATPANKSALALYERLGFEISTNYHMLLRVRK